MLGSHHVNRGKIHKSTRALCQSNKVKIQETVLMTLRSVYTYAQCHFVVIFCGTTHKYKQILTSLMRSPRFLPYSTSIKLLCFYNHIQYLRQYTTILVLIQLYFVRGDMFRLIIQPSSGQLTIERYLIILRPIWDPTLFTYNVYKKQIQRFHIYKITRENIQINDKNTSKRNVIFDTVIRGENNSKLTNR